MLILAGLGHKVEDIPFGTIKYLKKADFVFLESYTNIPNEKIVKFLKRIRKDIKIVYRNWVENKLENFIIKNKDKKILLLVSGNPLFATTHVSLIKFCKENKIRYKIIGGSSVMDYLPKTGLFIYKFGKTVSISFHYSETPYKVIKDNLKMNAHTLILLDIDPENSRVLTVKEALKRLLELENKFKDNIIDLNKKIIICERLGQKEEKIYYISIKKALSLEVNYPACIIYPANLNPIENEILECMSCYYEE